MTHHDMLISLLTTNPYVKIQDVRGWCDYRKRLSELRLEHGMDIRAIKVKEGSSDKWVRAYTLVKGPEHA